MATSKPTKTDPTAAQIHPWKIIEAACEPDRSGQFASLFALGNGYLGLRGAHEDLPLPEGPAKDGMRGTFLNGFYETSPILYGESAYGFADTAETMQNVADPLPIRLLVDGEVFDIRKAAVEGRLTAYERDLAMSYGQLERKLVWTTARGKEVRIDSRRLVSFTESAIACLVYRVTILDPEGAKVELHSIIEGNTQNKAGGDDPRLPRGSQSPTLLILHKQIDLAEQLLQLRERTVHSGLSLAVAIAHRSNVPLDRSATTAANTDADPVEAQRPRLVYSKQLTGLESLEVDKYIAFADSRTTPEQELDAAVRQLAFAAREKGYDSLRETQQAYLDTFWSRAQIRLQGDVALQQGLNFSSYHLLQSAGRDGLTSVAAKGLSGEGYEGHYFWDTEMYMFYFYLYSMPELARALLAYRYSILDQARDRAILMGHSRGALFPWRTISGRECSAYFPAGTAQAHINGDIALAAQAYLEATDDRDFLWTMGLEILLESAVYYLDLGFYDKRGFCINEVTGPDEYTALVNNNYYTNLIAQLTMEAAVKAVRTLEGDDAARLDKQFEQLGYNKTEIVTKLEEAAAAMYFPFSDELGIPLQDESFADREPWDFLGADKAKYPLLLHYHPLVIYRHRVSKQGDMLLAEFLRAERFSYEERSKSYDYYELFTTHDSSLSASGYSIMANWLGRAGKAFHYFMETARLDLDNTHGNTRDGLHLANMAGNWLALTAGYGGMQVRDGHLSFRPQLPPAWKSYDFRILFRGSLLDLKIVREGVTYELLEGPPLRFRHHDTEVTLTHEEPAQKLPLQSVIPEAARRAPLEAVLFDVDGVLLSTDEQHYQAWQQLCDEEGIYFDRSINQRLRGVSRMACVDILLERASRPYSDAEKHELAERKNGYYRDAIEALDETALLPGVTAFLDALKERGVRMASASSSKNAPTLLRRTGIEQYFEVQVDGTDIQHSKPHPQVFSLAAERLGVEPANCLVLEDAEAGIAAGRAAGCRSVALGHIAARFLELGADGAAWGLDKLEVDDLDFI